MTADSFFGDSGGTGVYVLPYARSIPIICEITGMKPFTLLYAFNDNVNIDSDIIECVKLVITQELDGKFLGYSDITPSNTGSALRTWEATDNQGIYQSLYPDGFWQHSNVIGKGEVIRYYTSTTSFYSAVVVARQVQLDPITRLNQTVLWVTNIRLVTTASANTDNFLTVVAQSTFPNSATIKGDISGASATVTATLAVDRTTNSLGNYYSVYLIPPGVVLAGAHTLSFTDSITNDTGSAQTITATKFVSYGELDNTTIINSVDPFVVTPVIPAPAPVAEPCLDYQGNPCGTDYGGNIAWNGG